MRCTSLELRDFCGIGPSMEQRLRAAGIHTAQQLCAAPREYLRAAWGSIEGERYWLQLRGFDLPERKTTTRLDRALARARTGTAQLRGRPLGPVQAAGESGDAIAARRFSRRRPVDPDPFPRARATIRSAIWHSPRSTTHRPCCICSASNCPRSNMPPRKRRWNPKRHPPLSVAVTLGGFETAAACVSRFPARGRQPRQEDEQGARSDQPALRQQRRVFRGNAGGGRHDAAPMRIPFSNIPETAFEEDVVTRETGNRSW